jgi:hypothetical protein
MEMGAAAMTISDKDCVMPAEKKVFLEMKNLVNDHVVCKPIHYNVMLASESKKIVLLNENHSFICIAIGVETFKC